MDELLIKVLARLLQAGSEQLKVLVGCELRVYKCVSDVGNYFLKFYIYFSK